MRVVFDNLAQSGWAELETYATVNGPTNDFVSAFTNRVFVPQTPETFAYDADGNMIEDGRFRYWWNGENRMVRAEEKLPPEGRAAHVVTYSYDHQGRNVAKDGALQIWDEYNIIAENAGTENVTYNTWGLDIDGTMQGAGGVGGLLAVVGNGDMSLPAYDANGNITEYVDSQGGVESHTDYSAFGRELMRNGRWNYFHGFSTKPWCRKSGLVEYQMRKYVPLYGRWISQDLAEEDIGGFNLLAYSVNNPIEYYDWLGYAFLDCMADCIERHDPLANLFDSIGENVARGVIAMPGVPKSVVGTALRVSGDAKRAGLLSATVKSGEKGFSHLAYQPIKSALLAIGIKRSTAALIAKAHPAVTVGYGGFLLGVEISCTFLCINEDGECGGNN